MSNINPFSLLKKGVVYIGIILLLSFLLNDKAVACNKVIISFLLIIFISLSEVFTKKINFGLSSIFFLFSLFFLGIAPLYQYVENVTLWGGEPLSDNVYLKTNIIIIGSLFLYKFFYYRTFNSRSKDCLFEEPINNNLQNNNFVILLLLSFVCSCYIFLFVYRGNVVNLLFRIDQESDGLNNSLGLINQFFIRPIPTICFFLYKKSLTTTPLKTFLLFILMAISFFPLAVPRFAVAAFYIPLAFLYINKLHKKYNLIYLLIFAILIIFPALDLVRSTNKEFSSSTILHMFLLGHFDSYQMFARTVFLEYITYGKQLLGVLFFFIPRFIWNEKPIGSGYLIAHESNLYFDNISMNFLGEGYINFGIIGTFIFVIGLAYFNAKMDLMYWTNHFIKPSKWLIYLMSLGMEFIILRGALLNIFPVYLGYLTSILFVNYISKK